MMKNSEPVVTVYKNKSFSTWPWLNGFLLTLPEETAITDFSFSRVTKNKDGISGIAEITVEKQPDHKKRNLNLLSLFVLPEGKSPEEIQKGINLELLLTKNGFCLYKQVK